jgi:N-acyl homoserine lactone hydrolase
MLHRRLGRAGLVLLAPLLMMLGGLMIGRSRLARLPPVRGGAPIEATLHLRGKPVRVIAVQTGTVSIKGCHHDGCLPEWVPYPLRFAAIVADPTLGARMPIWSYVIVHHEGVFVVDAGAAPSYNDDASWSPDPVSGQLVRSFIRLDVTEDEALPARLRALGIAPDDVRALVLTHQHIDHTCTVPGFPAADVWTTEAEERAAQSIGAVPWRWRGPTTHVRRVDAEGRLRDGLPLKGVALTSDGGLEALHTPGHTPGSITVRLRADEGELWFVGDTSFRAVDVSPEAPTSGIHTDVHGVRELQTWLRARPTPRAFLPSHDEAVATTLADVKRWASPRR